MVALKGSLQKNDLLFSLKKKYIRNFANMLARAEGYPGLRRPSRPRMMKSVVSDKVVSRAAHRRRKAE
ncbi:hypothetical protein COCNU_09G000360 [Cocos nucifera]|uniref:Uncharacterized protein n=1 Tax=Cocos nucifera TaxID=13894 RepID=A0A8K0N6Y8_COCNU|nr:hypothetical protein COCNU_09G000360 [Cocos nucifera]